MILLQENTEGVIQNWINIAVNNYGDSETMAGKFKNILIVWNNLLPPKKPMRLEYV